MSCGHNPYLVVHLARRVELDESCQPPQLRCQAPDVKEVETDSMSVTIQSQGGLMEAPMRVPFYDMVRRTEQSSKGLRKTRKSGSFRVRSKIDLRKILEKLEK